VKVHNPQGEILGSSDSERTFVLDKSGTIAINVESPKHQPIRFHAIDFFLDD
jgi:hypothetical protein